MSRRFARAVSCVAFGGALLAPLGCSSSSAVSAVVTGRTGAPRAAAVPTYLLEQGVPAPFDEVALLHVVVSSTPATPDPASPGWLDSRPPPAVEGVLRSVGERAASLGCDAVLFVRVDRGSSHVAVSGLGVRWRGSR